MKRSLIFVLTALFSMMLATSAFAQSTHSVSVTLIDASNNEPVSYATVSVTPKGSSDPAKYTLTGEKGTATLSGVKDGTYVFAAEMMGYLKYEKEITVKGENVSIGDVMLERDREMLEAAKVTDVGTPVTIKKDTIEYNATAFKTTESDVLEDLLKKLPGVEVNDDGSIVVNGQTVTKVYMEGKTFFMDDPQVATKNIPAKLVEKVKVVQKKSDQAEFTGIDDGQEETVLDLSVVGGTMSGLMANITAGVGHDIPSTSTPTSANNVSSLTNYDDYRYQGNLFLGNFTNGTQIFVIGNGNNGAGGMGFGGGGGMGGGMMGGGGMGGGMMGGGMGGFGGGGVTSSYMLGSNLGLNLFDDKMEASGNYSFNGSTTDSQSSTYTNNHLEEKGYDMITRRNSSSLSDSKGHSISMRIEHTFSPSASLIFQPQFSYRTSGSESVSTSSTQYDYFNDGLIDINDSWSSNTSNTKSLSASGNLMYRQRIVIPGRTLTVNVRYNLSNSLTDGYTQSLTNVFENPIEGTPASITLINQRNDQTSKQASINATATYTEPLGNYFYIEGNYSYGWNHSLSEKNAFSSGAYDSNTYTIDNHIYNRNGEVPDPSYSNSILNDYVNQSIGVNLLYQGDYLRAQVGASLRPTTTHNATTRASYQIDTTFTVLNWSPNAQIIWDANDYLNIRFFYRGNSSQPNISQLMPVPDNSNPINISLGNPSLAPYFSHNINGELRFNNRQKFSSANLRFNAGMVQNPIVNAQMIVYGRTFTMPFNGHDTYNGSLNLTTNNPIFTTRFTLSTQTGINGSRSYSYLGNIDVTKYFKDKDLFEFDYPAFLSDYSDISHSKDFILKSNTSMSANERITFTWRADDFDFRIGASTNYQRTWVDETVTTSTFRNAATGSFTWNWEAPGITFDTDMNYMWYNGYATNPTPTFLWNMEIEKLLFKNQASLSLRGYDLLGQTKNFSLSTNGTTYTESFTNSLGRDVIVAFTWRFNSFGGPRGRGGMGGMGGGRGMGGGMMGGGMPPMF